MVRTTWMVGDLPRRKGNWGPEEEKVRNWLFYRERSGDIIVEQHVHSLDVANWFLGAHPIRAMGGAGGRLVRTDIGDIMDHLSVTFEYPGGVLLSHSGNQFSRRFSRVVEEFWGAGGGVELSRAKVTVYDPNLGNWSLDARQDITIDTVEQFFARIRSGKVENIGVAAAESTLTGIMGLRAILERREVKWEEVASI
jgi:predicted dehydrogenase